jgi:hypothetical protein
VLLSTPGRSGISAIDIAARGSGSQAVASKPAFRPQYGAVSDEAKVFASSLTPCA